MPHGLLDNGGKEVSPDVATFESSAAKDMIHALCQTKPSLILNVEVLEGRNLAAKDRNGTSDPFLTLTLGEVKKTTHVVTKTLNPTWNQTLRFPVKTEEGSVLKVICWDKDRFRNDYMGEFEVILAEFIPGQHKAPSECIWFALEAKRSGHWKSKQDDKISGDIRLRLTVQDSYGYAIPPQGYRNLHVTARDAGSLDEGLDRLLHSADSTVARVIPSEASTVFDCGIDEGAQTERKTPEGVITEQDPLHTEGAGGVLFLKIDDLVSPLHGPEAAHPYCVKDPFLVTSLGSKSYRSKAMGKDGLFEFNDRLAINIEKHEVNYTMRFDIVNYHYFRPNTAIGSVMLPLQKVLGSQSKSDLQTGLYDFPGCTSSVILASVHEEQGRQARFLSPPTEAPGLLSQGSESRGTSSSRSSRSKSRNKIYRRLDKDSDSLSPTPYRHTESHLDQWKSYHKEEIASGGFTPYELPMNLFDQQNPHGSFDHVLHVRVKFVPYEELRQQFWRSMLQQYDTDENGTIDKIEMISMLDALNSTLDNATIDQFFTQWRPSNGGRDFITMDQAVICLEEKLLELRNVRLQQTHQPSNCKNEMSGDRSYSEALQNVFWFSNGMGDVLSSTTGSHPLQRVGTHRSDSVKVGMNLTDEHASSQMQPARPYSRSREPRELEYMTLLDECPICHEPDLASKKEMVDTDIITHIATCASSDWASVNNLTMAGFVTGSEAKRKWYTRIATELSYGGHTIGANNANTLVRDRATGIVSEERMAVYVRLGIRLLYQGLESRKMGNDKIRRLLRSLSIKQGHKYDDPASVSQIAGFIAFHRLDMSESLRTANEFMSFNEFFCRQLKPNARPCCSPSNPRIATCPADCRSIVFNRLADAQRVWVKGSEFSLERLLGAAYPKDVERYRNGALAIMRLAPQDYHRFHLPVDGVMGEPKLIAGEYYTVNPMAVRSALDVYGENVRYCIPVDSLCHGRVMIVCVGAMMVGSIVITRKGGETVKRAQELGYFKFGGSTLLVLFEPGMINFDEDLVRNSDSALETLVRVGGSMGRSTSHEPYDPKDPQIN